MLLLEPGIELRAESRVRARVALLFDTSRSMKFPAAPSGPTRAEELQRWAVQHQADLAQLAARFQVDVYGFDKELQPADLGRLSADPQGPSTDILGALTAAASAGSGGRPLAGFFVASDGTHHVIYRDVLGHIRELSWTTGGVADDDLTGLTGAPPAAGDPSAYVVPSGGSRHVVYRSADGHIHELLH